MKDKLFKEVVENLDLSEAVDLLRGRLMRDNVTIKTLSEIEDYDEQETVKGLKRNRIIAEQILDRIDFALSLIKGTEQYLNY